jgi:hypothetical protein
MQSAYINTGNRSESEIGNKLVEEKLNKASKKTEGLGVDFGIGITTENKTELGS